MISSHCHFQHWKLSQLAVSPINTCVLSFSNTPKALEKPFCFCCCCCCSSWWWWWWWWWWWCAHAFGIGGWVWVGVGLWERACLCDEIDQNGLTLSSWNVDHFTSLILCSSVSVTAYTIVRWGWGMCLIFLITSNWLSLRESMISGKYSLLHNEDLSGHRQGTEV